MHACTRDRKLLFHGEIGVHNVNTCMVQTGRTSASWPMSYRWRRRGGFLRMCRSTSLGVCSLGLCMHAYMHHVYACIHTCIQNTYILPCMHSCIRLYIQNAYMHTCIHRHIRRQAGRQTDRQTVYACMYACKHTCMHAYILTYMHSCMHAYWPARSPLRPIAPHCAHPQCLDRP